MARYIQEIRDLSAGIGTTNARIDALILEIRTDADLTTTEKAELETAINREVY